MTKAKYFMVVFGRNNYLQNKNEFTDFDTIIAKNLDAVLSKYNPKKPTNNVMFICDENNTLTKENIALEIRDVFYKSNPNYRDGGFVWVYELDNNVSIL